MKYGRGVIEGAPGVGKTRLSVWCSNKITSKDRNVIIIYTEPLRKLRDYVAGYFMDYGVQTFVLLAHDEYERKLERYIEKYGDYFKALKHHIDNDQCAYYQHWEDLFNYVASGGQVIVSTHRLGVFAWLILRKKFDEKKIILVVDEGEDFFYTVSQPVTEDFLLMLKSLDRRIYQKFRAGLKKFKNYYYYDSLIVSKVLFHSFVISATIPRSMMQVLVDDYQHPKYFLHGKKSKDTLIILDQKLYDKAREKWLPKVIQVADQVLTRRVPVGMTVRSKEVGEVVLREMLNRGWRVSHDVTGLHLDPFADLWLLVIGGRFYRGVSFKPEKGKIVRGNDERYDFPVAVGTYQHGILEVEYDEGAIKLPTIHPILQQLVEDPWKYHRELREGINVQSLFRFNRYRDEEHVMILLDRRLYTSLNVYLRNYVDTSKKIVVNDWNEMHEVIRRIL